MGHDIPIIACSEWTTLADGLVPPAYGEWSESPLVPLWPGDWSGGLPLLVRRLSPHSPKTGSAVLGEGSVDSARKYRAVSTAISNNRKQEMGERTPYPVDHFACFTSGSASPPAPLRLHSEHGKLGGRKHDQATSKALDFPVITHPIIVAWESA